MISVAFCGLKQFCNFAFIQKTHGGKGPLRPRFDTLPSTPNLRRTILQLPGKTLDSIAPRDSSPEAALPDVHHAQAAQSQRILWFSTVNFTLLFAVWLMFAVLGVPIQKEMGLSDVQLGWLTAVPLLNGAIWRLHFGIWADRIGGKKLLTGLMLFTAIPVFAVAFVQNFAQLLAAAFFIGFAGNAFSVGVSWNSAWFPRERQGYALGLFGAGNVGASITKLGAPALLAALPAAGFLGFVGWRAIPPVYAVLLVALALWMWFATPKADKTPAQNRPFRDLMAPLRRVQVWRFSLYYVVVFGAYVALSSFLPKYLVNVYDLDLKTAGFLTAIFIFPASLLRPLGGYLSDKLGARGLMYLTFVLMIFACAVLSAVVPPLWVFTTFLFFVGVAMGIGKAAVFRFIPSYYPNEVGAVGGLVGALGALGGFFLTFVFAYAVQITHIKQSAFLIVGFISIICLIWFHLSVLGLKRRALEALAVK